MTEKRFKSRCYEKQKNTVIYDKGDKLFDVSYRDFEDDYYLKMKLIPVVNKLNELSEKNKKLKQFKQQVINLIDEKIIFVDTCNQNYKLSNDYYRGALEILELLKKELQND